MKLELQQALKTANTMDQVAEIVIETVRQAKVKAGTDRAGYVAGIVTSDGPQHIANNIKVLQEYTDNVRMEQNFPVFSSTEVFNQSLFDRLNARALPQSVWYEFWRTVLSSGEVTDIFLTPRWDQSAGARDELETAKKHNLTIHHYLPSL